MSNDYFTSPTDQIPLTRARAAALNNLDAAVDAAFDKVPSETNLKQGKVTYAADSGSADAYVVSLPHAPASYADGLRVDFKIGNTNTGASTLNVNSLGAKTIKRLDGTALVAGDLPAAGIVTVFYNATTGYFYLTPSAMAAASAAATSATAAASSASAASSSASSAASSESAAAASAAAAAASLATMQSATPKFLAYLPTSNQSVSSGVATKVSLTAETFDIGSCFDTTNKTWTPNVAGYYSVHLCINMTCSGDTMNEAFASVYKNGAEHARGGQLNQSTGRSGHAAMVTTLIYMNGSTDYLEFYGYQSATLPAFYAGAVLTYAFGSLVQAA